MGMMEQGAAWLENQRATHLSVPITYTHKEGESQMVNATLGKTLFRAEDSYGMTIRTESRDFIVATSALNGEPKRGDRIEYDGRVYEVLAPNGEPCWRWSGSTHSTYRIHTKEIGGTDG